MFWGPSMTLRRLWTSCGEVGILRWCMYMGHVELGGLPLARGHHTWATWLRLGEMAPHVISNMMPSPHGLRLMVEGLQSP